MSTMIRGAQESDVWLSPASVDHPDAPASRTPVSTIASWPSPPIMTYVELAVAFSGWWLWQCRLVSPR